jgi:hypothetical protein
MAARMWAERRKIPKISGLVWLGIIQAASDGGTGNLLYQRTALADDFG